MQLIHCCVDYRSKKIVLVLILVILLSLKSDAAHYYFLAVNSFKFWVVWFADLQTVSSSGKPIQALDFVEKRVQRFSLLHPPHWVQTRPESLLRENSSHVW